MHDTLIIDQNIWNTRFRSDDYLYGIEPNRFFKEQLEHIIPGKILLLAEGEGRNAVYAASLGWVVTAIDWSSEAKNKALQLAKKNNVDITYVVGNLDSYMMEEGAYDAIGLFYLHLPSEKRIEMHRKALQALKPEGYLIFEAFSKEQLKNTSGGPKDIGLLFSLEEIVEDFISMDFSILSKEVIYLDEGKGHQGKADVIRFAGQKQVSSD